MLLGNIVLEEIVMSISSFRKRRTLCVLLSLKNNDVLTCHLLNTTMTAWNRRNSTEVNEANDFTLVLSSDSDSCSELSDTCMSNATTSGHIRNIANKSLRQPVCNVNKNSNGFINSALSLIK